MPSGSSLCEGLDPYSWALGPLSVFLHFRVGREETVTSAVAAAAAAATGERETTHGGGGGGAFAHTLSFSLSLSLPLLEAAPLGGSGWLLFFLPARQITCRNGVAARCGVRGQSGEGGGPPPSAVISASPAAMIYGPVMGFWSHDG